VVQIHSPFARYAHVISFFGRNEAFGPAGTYKTLIGLLPEEMTTPDADNNVPCCQWAVNFVANAFDV
jgi:hypothetical protein